MEHGGGTPGHANVAGFQHVERQDRRVDQVPHFMREEPEALVSPRGLALDVRLIPFASMLGNGPGDGVVEAAVQGAKVFGC